MNWRSVTALLLLAFAGGAGGFAWLSSSGSIPWETDKTEPLPAEPVAPASLSTSTTNAPSPMILQPSASQAESMLLVLSARRAIEAGKPLGDIGNRLQTTFGQSQPQALATIAEVNRKPVSNGALLAGFDKVAPQLVLPTGTVWDRTRYEIGTLFVIRRESAKPRPLALRVAKAREAILAGDIAEAARMVRALPGAVNAKDWLAEANRAIAVRQALDTLNGSALAVMPIAASPSGATTPPTKADVTPSTADE